MINHLVIPGYTPASTLPVKVMRRDGIYDMVADQRISPKASTWGTASLNVYPASMPLGATRYLLVQTPAGVTFPPTLCFSWLGTWQQAIMLQSRIALLPVRFDAEVTDYEVVLNDGVSEQTILVTARDVNLTTGTFAITTLWQNLVYSMGGQRIVIQGTGMNGVATVTDSESNDLTIEAVDDNWLVITMAEIVTPGAITLTFKNAGGTTLGTQAVTIAGTNELVGEASFWYDGIYITVSVPETDDYALFAEYGGDSYPASAGANTLLTVLNRNENAFVRICRRKDGQVISWCPYTVMSINGDVYFSNRANEYGVISISRSTLPAQFVIRYDTFDMPLRQEFVTI